MPTLNPSAATPLLLLMGVVASVAVHQLFLWFGRWRETLHPWVVAWCAISFVVLVGHYLQTVAETPDGAGLGARLAWISSLALITATRLYGSLDDKPATPDLETAQIEKVWKDLYAGLEGVPAIIDTETMVRYGVSATPTFVLLDRKGIVRLYAPTRLSEAELSRRLDEVLAEAP